MIISYIITYIFSRCIKFGSSNSIHSYQTRVHKLPHIKGDGRTDRQTDRRTSPTLYPSVSRGIIMYIVELWTIRDLANSRLVNSRLLPIFILVNSRLSLWTIRDFHFERFATKKVANRPK